MNLVSVKDLQQDNITLGTYTLRGWVRTARHSKNISFVELGDGTTVKGLQIVLDPSKVENYPQLALELSTGAALTVTGELITSPAKGQRYELQAQSCQVIGTADPETYPLQKKGHTLEFLREILHLRPRSNTFGAVFRLRSRAAYAIHTFFQERDFYYLTSPIISTSDCEGAGEMFQVTTLDLNKIPTQNGKTDFSKDFFAEQASLTVSGQLEGEVFATALSKIYTFGPTFRAENSNTTRHLAEFWMIEPEMAFYDLQDNYKLAYDFITYVIKDLLNNSRADLEFLAAREWADKDLLQSLEKVANSELKIIEYTEAIKILEASNQKFEYPVKWGIDLQSEHERYLTDQYVKGPVVITNYPKEIKAFYMRLNPDERTVAAMDILVPRLGEIVGGSQREERYDILSTRMKDCKLEEEKYWWYMDLRKYGSVPHAGFGLGFERLLMYVSGMQNIRDVIPFPRVPGFAKF